MLILLGHASLFAVTLFVVASESEVARPDPWGRILSLMEQGTAAGDGDSIEFLKSLSPEEMLLGARQACDEVARRSTEIKDMPASWAAEIYVMTCLHFYFEKTDRDGGAAVLLKIVSDREESPFLRHALISRMFDRDEPFDGEFQEYVSANERKVTAILVKLLKNPDEDPLVRKRAMDCLAGRLGRQVRMTTVSDANVHAIWEQSHEAVPVARLVRSGELSLTDDTLKTLEPLQARAAKYVKLLAAIVADERNESAELRKHARRALQRYKRLPFPDLDDEIDKALQHSVD